MDPTQPTVPTPQPMEPTPVAPSVNPMPTPMQAGPTPASPAGQPTQPVQPMQPLQQAAPLGQAAPTASPMTPGMPAASGNPALLDEIAKKTKTAGTISVVVAVINFAVLLLLVLFAGQDIQINWITTILSMLGVVGLFIFGLKLRQLSVTQDVPAIKQAIQLRLFPVMAVLIVLSAISGGGIGLLPLLIIVFAGQALRKISQYQKG